MFKQTKNVWTIDPVSGTKIFIEGKPHYSIVIAHLVNSEPVFAAVHDPSVDEMFMAYKNKGTFLNNKKIFVSGDNKRILFRESTGWKKPEISQKILSKLKTNYFVEENLYSMAVNYCWVACGRADGIVSFTKDSFPEFAGGLIIKEAGGKFSNFQGDEKISPSDRTFIGGNPKIFKDLFKILKNCAG